MPIRIVSSLDDIKPQDWNALLADDYPFLKHEFLSALERHQCVGNQFGWRPQHIVIYDNEELIAATPLYLKDNSYGEFVFDWNWADAYARAGLHYYPKLVSSIPYTPATGSRLLVKQGRPQQALQNQLVDAIFELANKTGSSSVHYLFPFQEQQQLLLERGFLPRKDCQYHWFNKDYQSFDEFLQQLSSSKRKKIKRERRRVQEQGLDIKVVHGNEASAKELAMADFFYRSTYDNKYGYPTFNLDFFTDISRTMGDQLVLFFACRNESPVAATICYRSSDVLYGRHWGCAEDFHSLHFELCYYQSIDYCIQHKLKCCEPGAQGEHKISRGFVPVETVSAHWIENKDFENAIKRILPLEAEHIDSIKAELEKHIPYRK